MVSVWTDRELCGPLRVLDLFVQNDLAVSCARILARGDQYELRIAMDPIEAHRLEVLEARILNIVSVDRARFTARHRQNPISSTRT